ncbi:MAG: C-terminal target protein, partial [Bacteroidota bacterium]|nr:C-terminal target protein [Bacteroidota bacterium]
YTSTAGNYSVTVTDTAGCTTSSNRVSVSSYPQSSVSISVNGDTLSSFNAAGYQWYFNSQPLPGDTNRILVATQSGSYLVQIRDTNGCYYNSTISTVNVGIPDLLPETDIQVYPNPLTSGNWHLDVSEALLGSLCEVFDANGRKVFSAEVADRHSEIVMDLSKGVYILQLRSKTGTYPFKLVRLN